MYAFLSTKSYYELIIFVLMTNPAKEFWGLANLGFQKIACHTTCGFQSYIFFCLLSEKKIMEFRASRNFPLEVASVSWVNLQRFLAPMGVL